MPTQEIVAIVDRSGSMRGKEADTVGGINSAFEEIRKNKTEEDTIRVSLKLFDNEEILKWRRKDINSVRDFPLSEFIPRGSTALLDALGNTLKYFMEMKLKDPAAYDSCLIYVATDGVENSSHHYTRDKIKELVAAAEKNYNITLVYLGANQNAILEATNLGINQDRAMNYSENFGATQAAYTAVGRVASCSRGHQDVHFTTAERQRSCEHSTSHNVSQSLPTGRSVTTPNSMVSSSQMHTKDIADIVKNISPLYTSYADAITANNITSADLFTHKESLSTLIEQIGVTNPIHKARLTTEFKNIIARLPHLISSLNAYPPQLPRSVAHPHHSIH